MSDGKLLIFVFKLYKDSVKIMALQKGADLIIPYLTLSDQGPIEIGRIVHRLSTEMEIHPMVVALEPLIVDELSVLPVFVDRKSDQANDPDYTVKVKNELMKVQWIYLRRMQRLFKDELMLDLYDKALDWVSDQDFATGILVNNLERLR